MEYDPMKRQESKELPKPKHEELTTPLRSVEGEELSPEGIQVLKDIIDQANKEQQKKPPALLN